MTDDYFANDEVLGLSWKGMTGQTNFELHPHT